eukprot:CAMPEP_0170181390 /NCGR_PEP_ID=MMETSP0040_2-20121228/25062_1 /TAXON_ID=641309 /ORGANISM="Lotharella oceanica, Strain CCMP622" /LENGTH=41 /DNA_ID= /DNA_START= /DNA_END= /DNA_ORIENTATION=
MAGGIDAVGGAIIRRSRCIPSLQLQHAREHPNNLQFILEGG